MTTWYVDPSAGTDSNASAGNGDSFATRRKRISNVVAAALAPGDTVRVMESPLSSLGITGVWTSAKKPATISITSSTNATPIVITKVAHGLVNGDTIYITGHTTNTNANGTWEVANKTADTFELANSIGNGVGGASGTIQLMNNMRITLASALTKNIASCGNRGSSVGIPTAWTASASVTCTVLTTDYKEGDRSDKIDIAAGFTTGLTAYWALGSAVDFSAYKQVSFWIKQTSGTIGALGATQIKLCSDTVGATPVDTLDVPALGSLNQWMPVTVNKGSALGASIQSIAFSVVTDNGAQIFQLSNIIACKDATSADSLTLTSLIGKNTAGETFSGIQSINGTRVILDGHTNVLPSAQLGYYGTTETVTTYKRETHKLTVSTSESPQESGTALLRNQLLGGWNTTDMTTRTGESWFDCQNGVGSNGGIWINAILYWDIDRINVVRSDLGTWYTNSCTNITWTNMHMNNNKTSAIKINNQGNLVEMGHSYEILAMNYNGQNNAPIFHSAFYNANTKIVSCKAIGNNTNSGVVHFSGDNFTAGKIELYNNSTGGLYGALLPNGATNVVIDEVIINDNSQYAISVLQSEVLIRKGSTSNNTSGSITTYAGTNSVGGARMTLRNFTMNEATEVQTQGVFSDGRIISEKHDGTAFNDKIFCDSGLITKVTDQLHGSSNYSWKLQPTGAHRLSNYPLYVKIGTIAVNSTGQVDFKVWARVDDVNMFMRLRLKANQVGGSTTDVTATSTGASVGAWEQLTVSFTPTEKGVVEYTIEGYTDDSATTLNGWASDPSVTQA